MTLADLSIACKKNSMPMKRTEWQRIKKCLVWASKLIDSYKLYSNVLVTHSFLWGSTKINWFMTLNKCSDVPFVSKRKNCISESANSRLTLSIVVIIVYIIYIDLVIISFICTLGVVHSEVMNELHFCTNW